MMKRKELVFLHKEKKKDFSLRINVQKDWLRDHISWAPCGIEIKMKCILKCLGFEFHCIKVRFLFFILEFKVTCYLSWMKLIHDCCFRCVFCMRCKTKFSNTWFCIKTVLDLPLYIYLYSLYKRILIIKKLLN